MRSLIGPHGILRSGAADGNAVVAAIAFVRTIGVMRCPNEQRHVRIVARQVIDGRVSLLFQSKSSRRFNDDPSRDRYTHPALGWRNLDRMVGTRNSDIFALA